MSPLEELKQAEMCRESLSCPFRHEQKIKDLDSYSSALLASPKIDELKSAKPIIVNPTNTIPPF